MILKDYHLVVQGSHKDGFSCCLLEIPTCLAQADTLEELWVNMQQAADSWETAAINTGYPIPLPFTQRIVAVEMSQEDYRQNQLSDGEDL